MRLSLDPVGVVARSPNYRWWAFASIGLGLFLVVADQSGINIALPSIAEEFGADLPTAVMSLNGHSSLLFEWV